MTAHKNVYTALAAAQTEMGSPVKGAVNPAFKSKYADLASVVEAVAPALNKHGLAFFHYTSRDDHGRYMVTVLAHGESDTKIECPVELIVGKQDMQGFKSATTYAKRIGLESVTGVAPEDDDGNAAAKSAPRQSSTITADQYRTLRQLIEGSGADEARMCAAYGIKQIEELPAGKFDHAVSALRRKIADRAKEPADA